MAMASMRTPRVHVGAYVTPAPRRRDPCGLGLRPFTATLALARRPPDGQVAGRWLVAEDRALRRGRRAAAQALALVCRVLKSPLAAGPEKRALAYAQTTSCIEQVRRAEQLSYTPEQGIDCA